MAFRQSQRIYLAEVQAQKSGGIVAATKSKVLSVPVPKVSKSSKLTEKTGCRLLKLCSGVHISKDRLQTRAARPHPFEARSRKARQQ